MGQPGHPAPWATAVAPHSRAWAFVVEGSRRPPSRIAGVDDGQHPQLAGQRVLAMRARAGRTGPRRARPVRGPLGVGDVVGPVRLAGVADAQHALGAGSVEGADAHGVEHAHEPQARDE
ncbi:hypothetical protein EGX94_10240 [Propionibacterium acidifaciens]|nr:hypothetical protein EGX94_10240 [Propionibacterium acidifaciens]